jgi:carboxyl-terminal processing protease
LVEPTSASITLITCWKDAERPGPPFESISPRRLRGLRRLFPPRGVVRYEGIGWRIRKVEGKFFASSVYDGGPAWRAGILAGDEIMSIDGADPSEVASLRGKSGRQVKISIRRSPKGRITTLEAIPELIEPNAFFLSAMRQSIKIIDRNGCRIGTVRPWSYAGDVFHTTLRRELSMGRLKDADALVLDLRDGWGGASPEYANLFAGCTPTMTLIDRTGVKQTASFRWPRKLVVLIDEATRSGKEVLAWALQQRGVPVVGVRSAGAVLAGQASILPDGSLLLVAVKDVLIDGVRLEGRGVAPDIEVPLRLPYAAAQDPQMAAALAEAARR